MAIAKLLHEGETVKQLKNTIRYNTVTKEYLNSPDNPRLLQAISNLGIIDISDPIRYQDFMREFINEITLNQSLSSNKRQKKLYAHEMISFEDEDNARFSQEELAQISIELLSDLYDMENTPYVIYPQKDSGRLHFHFIRSSFSSDGTYQRVKNSKRAMRVSCEAIELKYNLSLTGKNVSNAIRPANDPMAKVMKNRKLEEEYKYQKKLSTAKKQDSPLTMLKRKSYDLLMEDNYQSKMEVAEQHEYQKAQQNLAEKAQVNKKLEAVKETIFNLYKSATDEADFIEKSEKQGIAIELLKHAKSGKNKGIAFHYQGKTISGGKISSSMTLGKIKKRFPNFIHTLEKPPSLRSTHKLQRKILDFQIEQINRYYQQRKNNANDDILIYFSKKNIEARPYNYNLRLSSTRDLIRFGPSTPNNHDLKLSIDVALENGWQSATLTNSSPEFLKRMMKAAYQKDPKLLFFVQADKSNQLTYAYLKEIKADWTFDELKTAIRNNLIVESEVSILVDAMQEQAKTNDDVIFSNALKRGYNINELDKKTIIELRTLGQNNSLQPVQMKFKSEGNKITPMLDEERLSALADIKSEVSKFIKQPTHKNSLPQSKIKGP
jgi:FKBP-type peptidyl-prolyl cis-trans isomerase